MMAKFLFTQEELYNTQLSAALLIAGAQESQALRSEVQVN